MQGSGAPGDAAPVGPPGCVCRRWEAAPARADCRHPRDPTRARGLLRSREADDAHTHLPDMYRKAMALASPLRVGDQTAATSRTRHGAGGGKRRSMKVSVVSNIMMELLSHMINKIAFTSPGIPVMASHACTTPATRMRRRPTKGRAHNQEQDKAVPAKRSLTSTLIIGLTSSRRSRQIASRMMVELQRTCFSCCARPSHEHPAAPTHRQQALYPILPIVYFNGYSTLMAPSNEVLIPLELLSIKYYWTPDQEVGVFLVLW